MAWPGIEQGLPACKPDTLLRCFKNWLSYMYIPSPVTFSLITLDVVPELLGRRESPIMRFGKLLPEFWLITKMSQGDKTAQLYHDTNPGLLDYCSNALPNATPAGTVILSLCLTRIVPNLGQLSDLNCILFHAHTCKSWILNPH